MNNLAPEDKIFCLKTRKQKIETANKPFWDNTHSMLNQVKKDETEDEDNEDKKGYALLKKVYGGSSKSNNKLTNKVVSKIVNHLEEHQREGVGDPKDKKQSKQLKKEIKEINKYHLIPANKIPKSDPIYKYSNPKTVQKNAFELYGKDAVVYRSDKPEKKYQILDPTTGKFVYFGQMGYESYDKHKDQQRRESYLARAYNMKGDWKKNPYSPNWLAISLLW
jgi:hypothetical protein